jgi:hypothetical protein
MSVQIDPVTWDEMHNIFTAVKNGKALGYDGLNL